MDNETKKWIEEQIKLQDEIQKELNELYKWLDLAKKEFPNAKIKYKHKSTEEWNLYK